MDFNKDELKVIHTPSRTMPDKYLVKCQVCGAESKYKTESKVVKILLRKKRGKVVCKKCHNMAFSVYEIK